MWTNPQEWVTFTEEILNRKLHFLCDEWSVLLRISLVNVDLFTTKEILNWKLIFCTVSNISKTTIVLTRISFVLLKRPDNFLLTVSGALHTDHIQLQLIVTLIIMTDSICLTTNLYQNRRKDCSGIFWKYVKGKLSQKTPSLKKLLLTNCLDVVDHFVGLALKGLRTTLRVKSMKHSITIHCKFIV